MSTGHGSSPERDLLGLRPAAALEQYADVDVNGTYSLQTRVAFIADIGDNLYELHFNNLIIDLKPRENQQNHG